jgi:hypothetical protein
MALTYLNEKNSSSHIYSMPDNYIYLYHVGVMIVLPSYADSVTDTISPNFNQTTPLGRSAPIFSYQSSGPREVQVSFTLHRDMMKEINYSISNAPVVLSEPDGDDYVDLFIKYIQAAALPAYSTESKMVNPPIIALRLGEDIFIKGVVSGSVSLTYKYPILENGKYSTIDIAFSVAEVDPFDAATVMENGSYRGITTNLGSRNTYSKSSASSTNDYYSNLT